MCPPAYIVQRSGDYLRRCHRRYSAHVESRPVMAWCLRGAGRNDENIDAGLPQFIVQRSAEGQDVGLDRRVICQVRHWAGGNRRRDQDEGSAVSLDEVGAEPVRQRKRHSPVEGEDVQLVGQRVVEESSRGGNAGIRNDDPDVEIVNLTPQFVDRPLGQKVQGDRCRGDAVLTGEFGGQLLEPAFAACHQDDVDTRGSELPRKFLPNARGRSSHDGILAVLATQIFHVDSCPNDEGDDTECHHYRPLMTLGAIGRHDLYSGVMSRWEPNAPERLAAAAVELFAERGYDTVTVADIAQRAGLTKRTFFRHFVDKREVLFAGQETHRRLLVDAIADADATATPLEAIGAGLRAFSAGIGESRRDFLAKRQAIIGAKTDLQERELLKRAALTAVMAETLGQRGVDEPAAGLAAEIGALAMNSAYLRWLDPASHATLAELADQTLGELSSATRALR